MLDKTLKTFFKGIYPRLKDGENLIALSKIEEDFAFLVEKSQIRSLLLNLEREGFIDLTFADRKGEQFVYIQLQKKGVDYYNQKKSRTKELLLRIAFAIVSALVTFICGKILYGFFH